MRKYIKKKVEIALQPSSNLKYIRNYFLILKFQGYTNYKIYKSSIVIFHESSAVIDAIISNKKIISFQTKFLGEYLFNRTNYYKTNLQLPSINIDEVKDLETSNLSIIKKKLKFKKQLSKKIC